MGTGDILEEEKHHKQDYKGSMGRKKVIREKIRENPQQPMWSRFKVGTSKAADKLKEVGFPVVLLILCVNTVVEPANALAFSHRWHNELKSLGNKENVHMFLITWNKMRWQAINCEWKSNPQKPVVSLDNDSRPEPVKDKTEAIDKDYFRGWQIVRGPYNVQHLKRVHGLRKTA
ncbi:hypothetical protein P7K49_012459 [Saguinus oedipus]|uniref:Uncharacterized protein n=1 Tax=Saguinus oedipus TaxID=9490 RepID=A0ABQ9VTL9_SAGOE|nr:hypothetical protein P7K49_012459 [Saguinus oedipus]